MATRWRLLRDGAAVGAWNMGVDEALLATAIADGRPALRLYRWDGPWLSLGYGQALAPARRDACRAAGVGVVRRVTGGRAVLHGGDLTYAVAAPERLLPEGLAATYAWIARALEAALHALGVEAVPAPRPPPTAGRAAEFDCFAAPAGDELCVAGRKLVGSAQRRARGGVLQHGSIRVEPDPEPARAAAGIAGRAATSLVELGVGADFAALGDACVRAFERVLGAEFADEGLSERERRSAGERSEGLDDASGPGSATPWGASRVPLDGR